MARRLLVVLVVGLVVALGAGLAVATSGPDLRTSGPTSVTGTEASAVFQIGDRTIRQVRYADRGTLVYTFRLTNEGRLPVEVTGLARQDDPRLFDFVELVDGEGDRVFSIGAGDSRQVRLRLRMTGCETLSARAGSFVSELRLATSSPVGIGSGNVLVTLPEELRTGSPREAGCARATATSRPRA